MNKPNRKTVSAKQLTVDESVNVREHNRYKLPIMQEQICVAGRIIEPLVLEQHPEKGLLVLKGNRRTLAAKGMVEDPTIITAILVAMAEQETDARKAEEMKRNVAAKQAEILENLGKIEALVYSDLTNDERDSIIMDHGTVLTLCRTEVAKCVARMAKSGKSEMEIIRTLYSALAGYTGNAKKLAEVEAIKDQRAKEKALSTWLHGTVGNQILAALGMGPYIWEQFILTRRSEDRLLEDGEKVEMWCSSKRITELSAAKSEDKKGKGWDPERGGEKFNALITQYRAEDAGTITREEKKRPTVADLQKKADIFRTPAVRKALLFAAGETGEAISGLMEEDDRGYRDRVVLETLAEFWDRLPDGPAKDLATHVLNDSPNKVRDYLTETAKK